MGTIWIKGKWKKMKKKNRVGMDTKCTVHGKRKINKGITSSFAMFHFSFQLTWHAIAALTALWIKNITHCERTVTYYLKL